MVLALSAPSRKIAHTAFSVITKLLDKVLVSVDIWTSVEADLVRLQAAPGLCKLLIPEVGVDLSKLDLLEAANSCKAQMFLSCLHLLFASQSWTSASCAMHAFMPCALLWLVFLTLAWIAPSCIEPPMITFWACFLSAGVGHCTSQTKFCMMKHKSESEAITGTLNRLLEHLPMPSDPNEALPTPATSAWRAIRDSVCCACQLHIWAVLFQHLRRSEKNENVF